MKEYNIDTYLDDVMDDFFDECMEEEDELLIDELFREGDEHNGI